MTTTQAESLRDVEDRLRLPLTAIWSVCRSSSAGTPWHLDRVRESKPCFAASIGFAVRLWPTNQESDAERGI